MVLIPTPPSTSSEGTWTLLAPTPIPFLVRFGTKTEGKRDSFCSLKPPTIRFVAVRAAVRDRVAVAVTRAGFTGRGRVEVALRNEKAGWEGRGKAWAVPVLA